MTSGEGAAPPPAEMERGSLSGARSEPRTRPLLACPLCGASGARHFFTAPDRLHGTPGRFTYRHCRRCRTVFQDPLIIAEDLPLCYPQEYHTHGSPWGEDRSAAAPALGTLDAGPALSSVRRVRSTLGRSVRAAVRGTPPAGVWGWLGRALSRSRFVRLRAFALYLDRRMRERGVRYHGYVYDELLPRWAGSPRALGIGCGSGYHLVALQAAGYEAEGVEWDPVAAASARRFTRQTVWQGDFRQLDLPVAAYHLVMLHHVIEHLTDPLDVLRRLRDLVRPDGRIVLVYPNQNALGTRIFGETWLPWDPPRHLALPPGPALARAALTLGLKPVGLRSHAPEDAAAVSARSRALRAGRPMDRSHPDISVSDRFYAFAQRALVRFGLPAGDELILVLEKRPGARG